MFFLPPQLNRHEVFALPHGLHLRGWYSWGDLEIEPWGGQTITALRVICGGFHNWGISTIWMVDRGKAMKSGWLQWGTPHFRTPAFRASETRQSPFVEVRSSSTCEHHRRAMASILLLNNQKVLLLFLATHWGYVQHNSPNQLRIWNCGLSIRWAASKNVSRDFQSTFCFRSGSFPSKSSTFQQEI